MLILPKQPDALISGFASPDNLLPCKLNTNPFFFEWVFCSDLRNKDDLIHLKENSSCFSEIFHNARIQLAAFVSECYIINYSITQYRLLKGEFRSIEKEYKNSLKIIESCFQVANAYWDVIKKYLTENSFRKPDHEVYFFKIIKPAFTSECDFLSLAYHALLFSRAVDKNESFWEREKRRKEKLLQEHPDFFNNYLNGAIENDEFWFTRTRQVDHCSHDHIVSSWFAINRYEYFIESAILQSKN